MKKLIFIIACSAFFSALLSATGTYFVIKSQNSQVESVNLPDTDKPIPSNTDSSTKTPNSKQTSNNLPLNKLPNFIPVINSVKRSIVHISTSSGRGNAYLLRRYFGRRPRNEGSLGTGIIISEDGYIITNYHVIRGASRIEVKLHDGKIYPAFLKGRDSLTDVALIKIKCKDLTPAQLGDSQAMHIGAWVMAIGNPFGLSNTVTAGIISAKDRTDLNPNRFDYSSYIQTDTAINPGNSGGPLINIKGEVIGINTLVDTRGQGIGYAIPINRIKKIIPHLKKFGTVARSFLGVSVRELGSNEKIRYKYKNKHGILVVYVTKDSPADRAGIKKGDIIVSFGSKKIKNEQELAWEASIAGIGKKVNVEIFRDHKQIKLEVKLAAHPGNRVSQLSPKQMGKNPPFGLNVRTIRRGSGNTKVVITSTRPRSVGAKYGLNPGDRILSVGKHSVSNVSEYYEEISQYSFGQNVMLLIDSPNTTRWVVLPYK
ncbi:MAG: trypsin-like peptidase domain-containing protein [Deltaproteobacteria bacterium]|jgi:serine protease Do|nr:trypsin-like peptidase domain-containing protein [Deltaproteobacteria bacterium]